MIVRDDAITGTVVSPRVSEIIRLEALGEESFWKSAELISLELAGGTKTRELAGLLGYKSHTTVIYKARTWEKFGLLGDQRPSFNEAYHSPEVRGVPAPQPRPAVPPGPSPAPPSPQPGGQGQPPMRPRTPGPSPVPSDPPGWGPPGPEPGPVNPASLKGNAPIPGYDMTPEQFVDSCMGTAERFLTLAANRAMEIGIKDELRENVLLLIERIFQ